MTSTQPTISCIIPVYNTADYLPECLDSVLKQTMQDIEVIIVDDGSTDGCWEIIQRYANKDPRITSFQQNRKRQGAARNLGLRHATGQFISFVDSDDKLPEDIYQHMIDLAVTTSSDLIIGIQQSFNKRRMWRGVKLHADGLTDKIRSNIQIAEFPKLLTDISACNKLFRHKLITDNYVQFPEGCTGEDLFFTARLLILAENISVTPRVVYYYRGRVNATTGILGEYFFSGRVQNTLDLKSHFHVLKQDSLYPVLLRSEVKKLVANRLPRLILSATYKEWKSIFPLLTKVALELTEEDISENDNFTSYEQIRLRLLRKKAYECLTVFENNPCSQDMLSCLQQYQPSPLKQDLLLQVCIEESTTHQINDSWNLKSKFPRVCNRLTRLFRRARVNWKKIAGVSPIALIYYFILFPVCKFQKLFFKHEPVWLIDERLSTSANDNSFVLFEYIRKTYPQRKIYYVIKKSSPEFDKVNVVGQVIGKFSLKHAYYLHFARILISTDVFRSIAFPFYLFHRLWGDTHNVFLQHGVMAIKHTRYSRSRFPYISQVIVSSEQEKRIFIKDYHFQENQVSTTGLPRFDNLMANDRSKRSRQILVAPTWRRNLQTNDDIRKSNYYWAWMKLLNNQALSDLLDQYDATILFHLHPNMLPFVSNFSSDTDRISIHTGNEPEMSVLISESAMLITDYSSIIFDFLYQGKPAINYMFDRKEFENNQWGKSHIDIDTELPADISHSDSDVLVSLSNLLENNFELPTKYKQMSKHYFKYRDSNNCERTYQSIMKNG